MESQKLVKRQIIALGKAPFRTACRNSEGGVRSPRADFFVSLPIRTRAALGPRSTGTKTGPHGACLTAASLLAKREKCPLAAAAGNPVLGLSHRVESVASAASVSAERRRAADAQRAAALGADIGWTMRLSALRFPFIWKRFVGWAERKRSPRA